ncbi:hypothetical protein GGI17_000388 [Coemansia sp. S146]|nr:hypothetical protein GGI17_000388 [Coemansia sp. S146]
MSTSFDSDDEDYEMVDVLPKAMLDWDDTYCNLECSWDDTPPSKLDSSYYEMWSSHIDFHA